MLYDNTATDVLRERPTCDLCRERPAAVDFKTSRGPWGFACLPCFEEDGGKLGLGLGQRLLID